MKLLALVSVLALAGCGKEIGRIPFEGEGKGSATVKLASGPISFWTDEKLEWEGDAQLFYRVEVVKDGKVKITVDCDPLARHSVRTGWVETNIGSKHTRSGNGKMACSAELDGGGEVEIRATLELRKKPDHISITRADLVIKQ